MSPILHLDTDSAHVAFKVMKYDWVDMNDALYQLKKDTDGFLYQGGWAGPARDEFVRLWEEWGKKMQDYVNQLACLEDNLEIEVWEWNEASTAFTPS
jgi:uncharacterized protein YukE